jgi:hypothetical protein
MTSWHKRSKRISQAAANRRRNEEAKAKLARVTIIEHIEERVTKVEPTPMALAFQRAAMEAQV